jgi:hypothetical protein
LQPGLNFSHQWPNRVVFNAAHWIDREFPPACSSACAKMVTKRASSAGLRGEVGISLRAGKKTDCAGNAPRSTCTHSPFAPCAGISVRTQQANLLWLQGRVGHFKNDAAHSFVSEELSPVNRRLFFAPHAVNRCALASVGQKRDPRLRTAGNLANLG